MTVGGGRQEEFFYVGLSGRRQSPGAACFSWRVDSDQARWLRQDGGIHGCDARECRFSAATTTSTTCSTVMPFMQRKSIGHSRRKHGEHGASDFSEPMPRIARQSRPGQFRRRAAERHHDRRAQRGGHVHRAGVVRQQDAAEFQEVPSIRGGRFCRRDFEFRISDFEFGFDLFGDLHVAFRRRKSTRRNLFVFGFRARRR